jgi:hypothetical protein
MALDLTESIRAAAEHLDTCDYVMFCEAVEYDEDDDTNEQYQEAVDKLAAPFCGCNGCIAREAIYSGLEPLLKEFLRELVAYNENPDTAPCCIVGKRAWQYHVALMDISLGADNPKDLAAKVLGMKKENKE